MLNLGDILDVNTVLVFILVLLVIIFYFSTRLPRDFPPGPTPLPIIGSLLSLGTDPDKLHITLADLSKQYGPILGLKMGSYPAVMLQNLEVVKEAFVKKADYFRNRPQYLYAFSKVTRPGGTGPIRGLVWAHGEPWKTGRRFALSSMRDFGMGKKSIEVKVQEEALCVCTELSKVTGQPYDVTLLFQESISNIICSICFGSRFEYTDPVFNNLIDMLRYNFQSDLLTSVLNFIPILRIFPEKEGFRKVMANAAAVDKWMETQVEKHRETFDPNEIRDFVDLFLSNEDKNDQTFCPENMQRLILDLFVAGTETTSHTLRWILLFLIHHPEIQVKCQKELDGVIGSSRPPSLTDRQDLPFIEAVIHEGLRLGNVANVGIPHSAECDTTLSGYKIPKDTIVMVNFSAVHLNEKYFKDPKEFRPERWIGSDGKFQKNEAFIGFSMGPRVCLGESLARSELFLFLTSILQRFTFRMVDPNNPPSLVGKQGLSFSPRMFDVIIESR